MPAKDTKRTKNKNQYFHIYNRGVEGRVIFNDQADYETFLGYLRDYLSPPPSSQSIKKTFTVNGKAYKGIPHQPKNYFNEVELIAYCLMPNHFHLLLHEKTEGALERFNRSLFTRYSMYFNRKYRRSGALFGGRYKSIQVDDMLSVSLLTRDFHSTKNKSSYPEYLSKRDSSWVKTKGVLSFTKRRWESYQNFVEKYKLNQNEKDLLERIVFEREAEPVLEIGPQKTEVGVVSKPGFGFAELTAATVVFTLLLFLGLNNIQANAGQPVVGPISKSNPQVLSEEVEKEEVEIEETEPELAEEEVEVLETKEMVVIVLDDQSAKANIRQEPTVMSEKVGQAQDGDSFELISVDSDWYEIKLDDNVRGFISVELAQIKGEDN